MLNQETIASSFRNDYFNLIVMPTEQCNFRCTYCYEDFKVGYMSADLEDALCILIKRRAPSLKHFHLSWFGGEPLLSKSAIERVTIVARNSVKNDCMFQSNMSTNGALLDAKTMKRLSKAGVSHYQISLDGLPEQHNQTRINRAGKGSFEKIWFNAVQCSQTEANFEITFRIHITKKNASNIKSLVDMIADQFNGDCRFKVYFKAVEKLSENVDLSELVTGSEAQDIVSELEAQAEQIGMYDRRADVDICYAARPNSLVVRADGRIAKCTVAFNDNRNTVGHLLTGGELLIDQEKLRPWVSGLLNGDEDAASCPYLHL